MPASGGMSGLLEILVAHGGREDLPKLAHELTFEVDDLLPLVDAAQVLGLAEVEDADLQVTDDGRHLRRRRHPGVEADLRPEGPGAGAPGPSHLQGTAGDQRRQPR